MLTLSVLLALVIAEGLMRNRWRIGWSDYHLEMWRYAHDLKRISPDPRIGLEHRPNAEVQLMGVRIRTDAMGFRLPDPGTEARRSARAPAVLVIGDSMTL